MKANAKGKNFLSSLSYFIFETIKKNPVFALAVCALTFAISILSASGLGILIPLINMIGVAPSAPPNQWVTRTFELLHLSPTIVSVLSIFVFLQITRIILQYCQQVLISREEQKLTSQMQKMIFEKILRSPWKFITNSTAGHNVNALVYEVRQASAGFSYTANIFSDILIVLTYALMCFWISIPLTFTVIGMVIFSTFFLKPIFGKAQAHSDERVELRKSIQTLANDFLLQNKLIRTMAVEKWSLDKFFKSAEALSFNTHSYSKSGSLAKLLSESLSVLLLCGIVYLGVTKFHVNISEFTVLVLIFTRLSPQLNQIQDKAHTLISLVSSNEAVNDLTTELNSYPSESDGDLRIDAFQTALTFENVHFAHDSKPILKAVNLSIPAKKTTVFIGPSGSGKTTLLDLIIGLHHPSAGKILVDGKSIRELNLKSYRSLLAYVSQENILFNFTLRENLTFANPNITDEEIWNALDLTHSTEFVKNLKNGLDTNVGDSGMKLSGGQRQRLALARALLKKPAILILDEMTSALDLASEEKILESLKALRGKMSIVIVTHRTSALTDADFIYRVENGQILAEKSTS